MKFKAQLKLMIALFFITSLHSSLSTAAVSDDDLEVINLEDLYKKEEVKAAPQPSESITTEAPSEASVSEDSAVVTTDEKKVDPKPAEIKIQELKDLNQLVPFSEISVVQRKYLPKTQRFQLYAGLSLATNTPWYQNYGGKVNLGYNFTESLGLELSTLFLTSSARGIVNEIHDNNNVDADQFIYTKAYYGLHVTWAPIYGKIAFNNSSIINYEMYFAIGGGQSSTNSQEKNVTTIHIGTGQIFAITKSMAFRWDYGFNMFQATPTNPDATGKTEKSTYNDLVLTAGFSFFFPEATYR